jgi:hypothetical protein
MSLLVLLTILVASCSQRESIEGDHERSATLDPAARALALEELRDAFGQQMRNVLGNGMRDGARLGLASAGPEQLLAGAMRSDLRNLVTDEELHWVDSGRYTSNLGALRLRPLPHIIIRIHAADSLGFNATARSSLGRTWRAISVGTGPAAKLELLWQKEGEPACDT